jgi:hypothetical protein
MDLLQEDIDMTVHLSGKMTMANHQHRRIMDALLRLNLARLPWPTESSQKKYLGIREVARATDQFTTTQICTLTTHKAVIKKITGIPHLIPSLLFLKARVTISTPLSNPTSNDNFAMIILPTRICHSSAALVTQLSKLCLLSITITRRVAQEVLGVVVTKPWSTASRILNLL